MLKKMSQFLGEPRMSSLPVGVGRFHPFSEKTPLLSSQKRGLWVGKGI